MSFSFACSISRTICSSRALFAVCVLCLLFACFVCSSRDLFAVCVLCLQLQFVFSVCNLRALFSFPCALFPGHFAVRVLSLHIGFAVRVICFSSLVLFLQFATTLFSIPRVLHVFAVLGSSFHFACSFCSSRALCFPFRVRK